MSNEEHLIKYHSHRNGANDGPLNLAMLYGRNTFMFAVFAKNHTSCIEVAHVQLNPVSIQSDSTAVLSRLITNNLLHQKKFEKVQLSLLSSEFTMVPEAFITEIHTKELLKFTTGITDPFVTRHHKLNGLNFYYAANQNTISYFENTFRNISIRHSGAVSIDLIQSHHALANSQVFLNIYDSCLEITIKESNKLLFYNNFKFENNEDVLYFLLFSMEQFNLNPLHIKLTVGGQIEANGELSNSIRRYVKQVAFCTHHTSVKLESDLIKLPHHFYFTLLNQHLCEL